ncbi:PadR family transcriptional regulator [Mycobacterium sp.]|uniref:PadR family transcriptional regulator n=1 Tax=Mycobacterium sp. TaxID=1785 RepID=UPI003D139964
MVKPPSMSASSYVVLGLLDRHGPTTPYQLERIISASIGYFWGFPRSQLYAEATRLARHGLIGEHREDAGRRRRTLSLTDQGRDELNRWLAVSTDQPTEIRDEGLIRLFFTRDNTTAEDVRRLAVEQENAHRMRLADYESLVQRGVLPANSPQRATLEFGLKFERLAATFWAELAEHLGQGTV